MNSVNVPCFEQSYDKEITELFEVLLNLTLLEASIKEFGLTKQLVKLTGNERFFSKVLHVETDTLHEVSEKEAYNADNLPAVIEREVIPEGEIIEKKKAIWKRLWAAIVKFFNYIKDLGAKWFTHVGRLRRMSDFIKKGERIKDEWVDKKIPIIKALNIENRPPVSVFAMFNNVFADTFIIINEVYTFKTRYYEAIKHRDITKAIFASVNVIRPAAYTEKNILGQVEKKVGPYIVPLMKLIKEYAAVYGWKLTSLSTLRFFEAPYQVDVSKFVLYTHKKPMKELGFSNKNARDIIGYANDILELLSTKLKRSRKENDDYKKFIKLVSEKALEEIMPAETEKIKREIEFILVKFPYWIEKLSYNLTDLAVKMITTVIYANMYYSKKNSGTPKKTNQEETEETGEDVS